jgi:hypothetical protein
MPQSGKITWQDKMLRTIASARKSAAIHICASLIKSPVATNSEADAHTVNRAPSERCDWRHTRNWLVPKTRAGGGAENLLCHLTAGVGTV